MAPSVKGRKNKTMDNQVFTIFKNEEWEIKPMVSQRGNLCICVYYRGMHMGFCNIGDFKTQEMFLNFNCPQLVNKAKEIKKDLATKK